MAVIDAVGGWLFRLAAAFSGFFGGKRPADVRSILVIQLDHLGDAILSTVMLAPLKARYPQARMVVLASPSNAEVFRAAAEVDEVHVCRANRFARNRWRMGWVPAIFAWGWRLRGVDLAIDPRGELPHALLMWLTGARLRVGWNSGGGGFLLTHSPAYQPGRHEVSSRRALLAQLDIQPPEACRPAFAVSETSTAWAEDLLAELPIRGRRVILVHPGAGIPARRWPLQAWQALLDRLLSELVAYVVVLGSQPERETAEKLVRSLPEGTAVNLAGRSTLQQSAALLARADLFVGNDSGPAHLAAAVGTPAVVLFSGTNQPEQWRPWGEQVSVVRVSVECAPCHRNECPLADHPCMSHIEPESVFTQVRSLLGRGQPVQSASSEKERQTGKASQSRQASRIAS